MHLLDMVRGKRILVQPWRTLTGLTTQGWSINLLEDGEDPMAPVDRPPCKVVIQMFGGENLTMPPNPFASAGISATWGY